jgi:Tfp pilus assembly protein PilW
MKAFLSGTFASAMVLASTSAFAAGGYIQASSEEDQIVAAANKPQLVTMKSTDAAKGIKNNNGVVVLDQSGTYFTIVGVQVGSRGGTGLVRLWFQTNGKDADNTNCEQEVPTASYTTVMISQGVGEYKKGDKVNAMISGSAPGIGLVYKKPAGEPAVPSVIFSAWKID